MTHSFNGRLYRLVVGLTCALWISAVQAEWKTERQGRDLVVQSRAVPGASTREVRAIVELNADVIAVAHFLQDPATNPRWVPNSQTVSIIERPAQGVSLAHFVMGASWPFQPRDAVARFELIQSANAVVWIRFDSQPQRLPAAKGVVRLQTYSGCWRLTPLAPLRTHIDYRSHIEAGGQIPAWVAHSVAVRSTYKAMKNLQRQVPGYMVPQDSPLAFLRAAEQFPTEVASMGDRDCDSAFARE